MYRVIVQFLLYVSNENMKEAQYSPIVSEKLERRRYRIWRPCDADLSLLPLLCKSLFEVQY